MKPPNKKVYLKKKKKDSNVQIRISFPCNFSNFLVQWSLSYSRVTLTFSAQEQLVFTGRQNIFNWTSLKENIISKWLNRQAKPSIDLAHAWTVKNPANWQFLQNHLILTSSSFHFCVYTEMIPLPHNGPSKWLSCGQMFTKDQSLKKKKFRPEWDLSWWPLPYWYSALTTDL